ncbi:MAG: protein tyrosine phosphatase [Candidatus Kentron sp. G]|nr:MAG: protein tyrosine phosphatase [Candidatus Kentron sp. G]VFM99456.1 MAG: protein tyrosine phosphatase [Candidatus Kentron sp. G]VFN02453.1 MAG: protein tyrosine phosphatase [Candidatus Kentron sp. G]
MLESVLMICIGNICRSPMAEGLLKSRIAELGQDLRVESAGLMAAVGYPADPLAVELMENRGIDITAHRARQLTMGILRGFDVVMVMEHRQRQTIERLMPVARGRVFTLGRWNNVEIADPMGKSREYFQQTHALIEQGIDSWMHYFHKVIAGKEYTGLRGNFVRIQGAMTGA